MVFCEGKTAEQVVAICERLAAMTAGFLGTRCSEAQAARGARRVSRPRSGRRSRARCTSCRKAAPEAPPDAGTILVVSAGTSDLPVAEEAAVVAEAFGHRVERLADVGVAGIHRLLASSRAAARRRA